MARNGESLCQSVFNDCLLQTDHSDHTVRFVSSRDNLDMDSMVIKKVLEIVEQDNPTPAVEKLRALVEAFESYEEDKSNTLQCERFCQTLFDWIPWLMQFVKDCFIVHPNTELTGIILDFPFLNLDKTRPREDQTYQTFREKSLELIELFSLHKVSLV